MLRFIGLVGLSLLLSGCFFEKATLSPAERAAQEQRMRDFLNDSSPRNMNQQSKATPEFTKRFQMPASRKKESLETSKPSDSDYLEPGRD